MVKNVIEDVVVPESPKVLPNEQLQVYVPTASNTQKGIAKFNDGPFEVVDGEVKIKEEYLNDVISKGFVAKSKLSSNVYGTDDDGNDVNIPYSTDAEASKIVKRTLEGDVVVPTYTTEPNAAISRKYFLEQLARRVPVVKNVTLDSKFLYSYFYDNAGNARLVKADSELDSEIAVRLQDGHLRVPYSPLSRFTVDTAVNSKYLLDNYSTTAVINDKIQASEDRLSLNDVTGFTIEPTKEFGVYKFKVTFGGGDFLIQQLDLPFEAVQLASVDDYIGDDGKRYLEIHFVDENITPLNIELDEIFNLDNLVKNEIHIGAEAPTGDETLWVDTDEEGGSSGESSGGADIDVTAEVGQTIIVKEVDANSKPTKWEAASYQERICGTEYGIIVPDANVSVILGTGVYDVSLPLVPVVGKTYTVDWRGYFDGVYTCTAVEIPALGEGVVGFGNTTFANYADMPFLFFCEQAGGPITKLVTGDSISDTEVTFSISGEVSEKIPTKYVPTLEEMRGTVILPETTVEIPTEGDLAGIGILPTLDLVDGATYTVNYNGVKYICICASYEGMIGVGNFGAVNENFPNYNEPFVLGLVDGAYIVVPLDGSTTVTISITRAAPIPTEYLTNALPFYIEATADKAVDGNSGPTNYAFTTPAKDLSKAYSEGREIKLRLRITETAGPLTYNLVTKAVNGIYFFVVPFSDFGNMNMPAYMFFGNVDEFLQIVESSDGTLVLYSD